MKEKIEALKLKAAIKQAAIDACDGHIWEADYVSQIVGGGGSAVCVRCGERRAWFAIGPNEQWKDPTPVTTPAQKL